MPPGAKAHQARFLPNSLIQNNLNLASHPNRSKSSGGKGISVRPRYIAAFAVALCTLTAPRTKALVRAGQERALSEYRRDVVARGAPRSPLLSDLYYRLALRELDRGNEDRAEGLLRQAVSLDPHSPDPYFTLARICAGQRRADCFYYLNKALTAIGSNFHLQGLLVVNALVLFLFLFLLVSAVFGLALAVKYVPFAAHNLQEVLRARWPRARTSLASYLLVLSPFVLFPGLVSFFALVVLLSWRYQRKREKSLVMLLFVLFATIGFGARWAAWLQPLIDPGSAASLVAKANDAPGDYQLIRRLERISSPRVEIYRDYALGLLHLRHENLLTASDYFLRAVAEEPTNGKAFVNLGNVYFLQGDIERAIEGYRHAAAIDSSLPVCYYNLAQAYIKRLLMGASSRALNRANYLGMEEVKSSYLPEAASSIQVFPATLTPWELWQLAAREGGDDPAILASLRALTRIPWSAMGWIFLGTILLALVSGRIVGARSLAFPCSNCGALTCEACCSEERGTPLCRACAETTAAVSSEKVVEALLRQRRQGAGIKKRRTVRLVTTVVPGLRDFYYGRTLRGAFLSSLFSLGVIELWARGFVIESWNRLCTPDPFWKGVLPFALIGSAYIGTLMRSSKHLVPPGTAATTRGTTAMRPAPRKKAAG